MQSSRDSSIWRSLAVAFGDGVAFGVGVKLAQRPTRPVAGASSPSADRSASVSERLEQVEQRLTTIEHAPPPPILAPPSAPAPFDQKVLEAVINALDARLKEQAGQVERRLTELEAKIAIELKSLERQDHSIVTGMQARLDEVHGQYNDHVTAIRDAVAQDLDTLYGQLAQLRQTLAATSVESMAAQIEARIVPAVTSQAESLIESRMQTMEARLHSQLTMAVERASLQVMSAAKARLDDQLAPVHAALAQKDREIAELRQRIVDSDQSVLDLILAMGQMCRQVADRISGPAPAEARPAAGPPDPPVAPPPSEEPSEPPAAEPPAPSTMMLDVAAANGDTNGHSPVGPMPVAAAETSVPAFSEVHGPSRLWRIPLVSSFLILAAGSLWLLR